MRVPTDLEILSLDDELASEGVAVNERANQALQRWLRRSAWSGDFISIARHFDERFNDLHPSIRTEGRPFMYLCASARGAAYEYHPPLILGELSVSPTDPLQISKGELERVWRSEPAAYWELFYQCCDCFDLFMTHIDNVVTDAEGAGFAASAKDQLQASARQLVAMASDHSLAQACCLATELAGKAVLRQLSYGLVQPLGHRTTKIYAEIVRLSPAPTDAEVLAMSERIPDYVSVRYGPPVLNAMEAQALFAKALFLCADAFRRLGRQSMYYSAASDPGVPSRTFQ